MDILKQFIRFGIVGVSNTVIGYLIYVISLKLMRFYNIMPLYDIYMAQIIMFILSVAWSFYWNNRYVFKTSTAQRYILLINLLKTYVSYSFTSLFLSSALLGVWVNFFYIDEFFAPILNLLITVPLNFFVQKYWVFCDNNSNKK